MFCPRGKSHKKLLEEEGLISFIEIDVKKSQLCPLSIFSSGEDLFQHVVRTKSYRSMVHLGFIHYLSTLYEKEIIPPQNRKRVSKYHNIPLDITNCYTFCIKR